MEERSKEQKRARMVNQSWTMENLPLHILMEIISRLPIKTVMSIRCVCKTLLSLVSDSHFQMLHYTRAPSELMFSCWTKSSTTISTIEYVFVDGSLTAVDTESNVVFELPNFSLMSDNYCNFGATQTIVSFVNSCYGLVCYWGPSGDRFAVICNPFTREYVTFPCPDMMNNNVVRFCYGLGFSHKDNSFKLLRLTYRKYDSGEEKSRTDGEIYTFGESGSLWKRVVNRPYVHMSGMEQVIFHEGALHWLCASGDAIVTFDLDTELFGKLVTPPLMGDMTLAIGVFENCLYTVGCVGDYVDIWALKECGQASQCSWIKIFSIRNDQDVNIWSEHYEPLKYLQNGEVLMCKNFDGIVCFNPNTGSFKNVGGIYGSNGAVLIRPSLVSLKVLLGDNVKVHSVKPWYRTKAATIPPVWTSSVAVEDVVNADQDSQGCVPGTSAPSSSEASASTSHSSEEKVKEDVVPAILESQQGGADVGS